MTTLPFKGLRATDANDGHFQNTRLRLYTPLTQVSTSCIVSLFIPPSVRPSVRLSVCLFADVHGDAACDEQREQTDRQTGAWTDDTISLASCVCSKLSKVKTKGMMYRKNDQLPQL